ncbi:MAG TPA: hypothetical protein VGQ76_10655 [Thermoanaerobaculia bacterium]|jgi:hypothetical protein|nr:hypothetical protein [Thermoanaerobaculia bacterium]
MGTATIAASEHEEFMELLGLEKIVQSAFHPFVHEIVSVEESPDDDAPVTIVKEHWPAYMLGPLLITRAGCVVRAGAKQLTKSIAENATLYWAFARRNRPAFDMSVGWGSNSQWRTTFRRDYRLAGVLHYNVDANPMKADRQDDLTPEERLELLRYRSFVRCAKPHDDRFPYYYSHREEL